MSSMGSSIFLGATSTFLGVLCLSLSTSDIMRDIFKAVVGLIVFGVINGLIFLPVALAHLGPEENTAVTCAGPQPSELVYSAEPKDSAEEPPSPTVSPVSSAGSEKTHNFAV